MGKMSELSRALDELTACGEGLIHAANALRDLFSGEPETQSEPAPAETTEVTAAEKPKKYTFVEVREACAEKSHAGYTKQVRELIARYGADRLSAVKEEDYPALMAELEAIT